MISPLLRPKNLKNECIARILPHLNLQPSLAALSSMQCFPVHLQGMCQDARRPHLSEGHIQCCFRASSSSSTESAAALAVGPAFSCVVAFEGLNCTHHASTTQTRIKASQTLQAKSRTEWRARVRQCVSKPYTERRSRHRCKSASSSDSSHHSREHLCARGCRSNQSQQKTCFLTGIKICFNSFVQREVMKQITRLAS